DWNANWHDHTIEIAGGRVQVLDLPPDKAKEVADLVSTTDGLIVHFYYDGDMPNGRTSVAQAVGHKPMNEGELDRKSTRLNSSHGSISYAVFCLKKKINSQWIRTQDEAR